MSATSLSGPRRQMLADGTYEAIKAMILDHAISPGEHLGIDVLARLLAVSQTPVREALARLEADGLVSKAPLRGYEATKMLTLEEFDDLFQFRAVLEPWAAAEASRRASRLEIRALQAELDTARQISESDASAAYTAFVEHDTRFHLLVARTSGNQFLEDAFQRTHCHMHLFRVYKATLRIEEEPTTTGNVAREMFEEYYRRGQRPLALAEHSQIVGSIALGYGEQAYRLMLEHIESSRKRFITAVEAFGSHLNTPAD